MTTPPRIKLFQPSAAFHIETTHLFCCAKQMTGFYMKCNTGLKLVSSFPTATPFTLSIDQTPVMNITLIIRQKFQ